MARRQSAYETIGETEEEHLLPSRSSSIHKSVEGQEEEEEPVSYVSQFPKWIQIAITVSLFMGGLNMGLNLSIMGPVLPDLQLITGTSAQVMSTIFIWRSVAFMAGSISSGFIIERMNGFLFIAISLILQAISRIVTPWMTDIIVLSAVNATSIFFSTCVITCTSFLCFQTFTGKKTRIMVQMVFLVYQIGKVVTPFMIWPFLADDVGRNVSTIVSEPIVHPPHQLWLMPDWALWVLKFPELALGDKLIKNETVWVELPPVTHVQYVFIIVGSFSILMSTIYFFVFIRTGCVFGNPFTTNFSKKDFQNKEMKGAAKPTESGAPPLHIIICFFIMTSLIGGVEATDTGILMIFVVEFLGWNKDKGIFLMAMYQTVKVIACVFLMPFVRRLKPSIILTSDYIALFGASILMAVMIGTDGNQILLWFSVAAFALGGSNLYATNFTFLETRYTIGGRTSSLFTVSLGVGMMVFPFTTTALMTKYGPIFYPVVLLVAIIASFGMFIFTSNMMGEGLCTKKKEEAVIILEKPLLEDGSGSIEPDYEAIRKIYTENYHRSPMVRRGRLSVDWLATRDKM